MYVAYGEAQADVQEFGTLDVPLRFRNAPTKLMKQLDYGRGYRYAHDEAGGFAAGETYFPDDIGTPPNFYRPTGRGLEQQIADKLARLRAANRGTDADDQSS